MSSALDMSLDDLIKNNKQQKSDRGGGGGGGGFRGRGGGSGRGTGSASNSGPLRSGGGPSRRFPNRSANRATPYSIAKAFQAPNALFAFDTFGGGDRSSAIETGTKLYVSNLDYGVSNEDIKELFSEVGDLKRYSIHYDRSGRSKGTAEVVFSRRTDAAAAVKRYNNVQLDGKPMKIEIVGTNIVTPAIVPAVTNGIFGNPNGVPRRGLGRGGAMGRARGGRGGRSTMGRGRGRGRGRGKPVSVDDLDADLEKYHTEAMQVN